MRFLDFWNGFAAVANLTSTLGGGIEKGARPTGPAWLGHMYCPTVVAIDGFDRVIIYERYDLAPMSIERAILSLWEFVFCLSSCGSMKVQRRPQW